MYMHYININSNRFFTTRNRQITLMVPFNNIILVQSYTGNPFVMMVESAFH